MTHARKLTPGHFRAVKRGDRRHDFCRDAGFAEGHQVLYQEWDPAEDELTGDELMMRITSLTRGPDHDVPRGFVAMSVTPMTMPGHVRGDLAASRKRRDAAGAEDL